MSEYCREWAQNNAHDHDFADHAFDYRPTSLYTPLMTAHKPPRPPSPGAPSLVPSIRVPPPADSDEEADDDDGLSLNSSDLGASWQNVERSESGTSVSGSVSALGSAAVSDLEPSSDSEHEWNSDFDSEGPTLRKIPHVSQEDHSDSDSDSEVGDTPSPYDSFQRSFIFPDPNSTSASLSSSKNDTTPVPSFIDITAKDLKTPSASLFESALDGRKTERVTLDDARDLTSGAGPSRAQKPFPVGPPKPQRRQLTALVSVFAFSLIFLKLGPAAVNFNYSGLLASTFTPPGPLDAAPHVTTTAPASPGWLAADLQVVRDALSVFSPAEQDTASIPTTDSPSQPDHTVAEATSTAYRWFRSEYRWSREDETRPVTDVVAVPSSALITTTQQIAASLNESYDNMGSVLQGSIQLVSEYVSWSLQNLAAYVAYSVDTLRKEVETEIRQIRALAAALYNPEHVQAILNRAATGAASSQKVLKTSIQRASRMSARFCANDRCSPAHVRDVAARAFSEAHQRGYSTLKHARRGLTAVISAANDAIDKATSESQGQYVSERDCLRDRDDKRSCRRNKRSGSWFKQTGSRSKDKRCKKHKREAKTKGHVHNKCSVTDRLARRCGAGVAVSRTSRPKGLTKQRA